MKRRRPPPSPGQRKAAMAFAAVVAVLGLLGWWAVKFGSTAVESPGISRPADAGDPAAWPDEVTLARLAGELPTLSVRPFEAPRGDALAATVARGLAWDLRERLGQLSSLRVIGLEGAEPAQDRQALARYEVGGDVQSGARDVQVQATLTDRQSGHRIWTARFGKAPREVLSLHDEIAEKLAEALPVAVNELERRRLSSPRTRSPQAFETFLRGQAAFLERTAGDNARARELFREAISMDPKFARAYAAIAMTHIEDYRLRRDKGREDSLAEARRMADAAYLIDPASREAHWVRSFIAMGERRYGDAKAAIGQALVIDPSYADAYALLAWIHVFEDQPDRAAAMMRVAMRLSPAVPRRAWLDRMPAADEGQRRRLDDALKEPGP